ncbi:MAG TPA: hypothetical protein PLD47_03910 [Aggregatilineales bacterium]|nr:hypothetical protein [Anaerolineales bacterium]HRE46847.1 hypothetical protein [Aggregatilineales bacterium]
MTLPSFSTLLRLALLAVIGGGVGLALLLAAGAGSPTPTGTAVPLTSISIVPIALPPPPFTLSMEGVWRGERFGWWGVDLDTISVLISEDGFVRIPPFHPDSAAFPHLHRASVANTITIQLDAVGIAIIRLNHEIVWRGDIPLPKRVQIIGAEGVSGLAGTLWQ